MLISKKPPYQIWNERRIEFNTIHERCADSSSVAADNQIGRYHCRCKAFTRHAPAPQPFLSFFPNHNSGGSCMCIHYETVHGDDEPTTQSADCICPYTTEPQPVAIGKKNTQTLIRMIVCVYHPRSGCRRCPISRGRQEKYVTDSCDTTFPNTRTFFITHILECAPSLLTAYIQHVNGRAGTQLSD